MICLAIAIICFQVNSCRETIKKIGDLASFFPKPDTLKKVETSINKTIIDSPVRLHDFITNPPPKHVSVSARPLDSDGQDEDAPDIPENEETVEYSDVTLIELKISNRAFDEVIYETDSYLCKNVGTSADFSILQDICERKLETLETQITNSINIPLYLGLVGTFVGIILGLFGVMPNLGELFENGNMDPLRNLLMGVAIAMSASLAGLGMMIHSSVLYRKAVSSCGRYKNAYYDFLRRELMPTLSNSMASSLNALKRVLGEFVGKFGHNLDAYVDSAELLNDNIEKQHSLLVEVNKMKKKEIAAEMAKMFESLRESSESLNIFRSYQDRLNETVDQVNSVVGKIERVIHSFDSFATALKIVVENQAAASNLQNQFMTAIEKHFPTDSDIREMYRRQFDELATDAKTVSEELNEQLKESTVYIRTFLEDNRRSFESIAQINGVLGKLVEYSDMQSKCYKDLKEAIAQLSQEQIDSRKDATRLNQELCDVLKEMADAIRTTKA